MLAKLESAIRKAGDPFVPLRLKTYRAATFRVRFKVKVDPVFDKPAVLAGVIDRLRDRFSFAARAFGQAVALAEVIATVQAVPGVVAVDVDRLIRTDGVGGSGLDQPLPAAVPAAELAHRRGRRRAAHAVGRSDRARRHAMSFDAQRLFELLPVDPPPARRPGAATPTRCAR